MLQYRVQAAAEKQVKGFLQADLDAIARPGLRDRQRQLSTSLSTSTPSQSKMMRWGRIIAWVRNFGCDHILRGRAIAQSNAGS